MEGVRGRSRRRQRELDDLPTLLSDDALLEWGRDLVTTPDRQWETDLVAIPAPVHVLPEAAEVAEVALDRRPARSLPQSRRRSRPLLPEPRPAQADDGPVFVLDVVAVPEPTEYADSFVAEADDEIWADEVGPLAEASDEAGGSVEMLSEGVAAELRDEPTDVVPIRPPGARAAPLVARNRRIRAELHSRALAAVPQNAVPRAVVTQPPARGALRTSPPHAVTPSGGQDRLRARLAEIEDDDFGPVGGP